MSNLIRVAAKRNHLLVLTSGLAMVLALAFIAAAGQLAQAAPQQPAFDPKNFDSPVANAFFPLNPGTTYNYEGVAEDGRTPTSNVVSVTDQTKKILGVKAIVVHDQAFEPDSTGVQKPVEDTFDWFAPDNDGNVWYLGEDSKELDPDTGEVISTEGSWEAGKPVPSPGTGIAKPGIIMLADPQVGDTYQQEFAKGVAEDMAQVLSLSASTCVPYKDAGHPDGCFNELLLTKEWTPLEKNVVDNKYYAKGIGFIRSVMVKGGKEHSELVSITPGG